jgi:hypothetical protein
MNVSNPAGPHSSPRTPIDEDRGGGHANPEPSHHPHAPNVAPIVIAARICFQGGSISRLCPKIEDEHDIWDFTSISVLVRSLFESIMFFEYFCDSTEPDEWLTKMLLMHFHHRCERVRLFTELKKPEDVAGFSGEAEVLRGQLCENAFFGRLEVSRQKELLNGYNPAILTLRQTADKYSPEEGSMTIFQIPFQLSSPLSSQLLEKRRQKKRWSAKRY